MPENHPTRNRNRQRRDAVISFRLQEAEKTRLEEYYRKHPAVGVRSPADYARKVVLDFLDGQLPYLNRQAESVNPIIYS